MSSEGSQVFLQTTRAITYDIKMAEPAKKGHKMAGGETMSVFLRNCRIHLANNRRNLDTRFFATPVSGVSARQKHKDVELRISLKEPATATPRTEAGPDGTEFLVLSFPPGKAEAPSGSGAEKETK
jgi:hypothetical protein